jgi:hypothetical protein
MADPHLFTHGLNQAAGLGAAAMAVDDETGGKNGEKGVENETEGENVEMAVSTGNNDDFDANSTEVTVGKNTIPAL